MPRNRFVNTERVRLDLTDDDWIEVKRHLNYGEFLSLQTAGLTGISADAVFRTNGAQPGQGADAAQARVDMQRWMIEVFSIWIVDWSFQDEKGKQRPVTRDAIRNLDMDTANEISQAIEANQARMEEEKKASTTTTEPAPT